MSGRNQETAGLIAGCGDPAPAPVVEAPKCKPAAPTKLGLILDFQRKQARLHPDEAAYKPGYLSESATTGPDPIRQLWGPVANGPVDGTGLGRNVAQFPRTDGAGNLLWTPVVLSVKTVPRGYKATLRGFRQYLTIASFLGHVPQGKLFEFPVTTPSWTFPDGGVRWHISHMPGRGNASGVIAAPATEDPRGATPMRMGLGTFYDIRAPWTEIDPGYDAVFHGYDTIVMWAEVLPPDPEAQDAFGFTAEELHLLAPEDGFVELALNRGSTVGYWRIAGSLIVQYDTE